MKVTSMRTNKGEIPSTDTILALERSLRAAFKRSGFVSDANAITRTSMKIGLHMCSFRIDTVKLGHNADYGDCGQQCKAGFKLTSVPTWSQREQMNHLINDVFDRFKLSANIKSGHFVLRNRKTGRVNEWSAFHSAYNSERLFEIRELS